MHKIDIQTQVDWNQRKKLCIIRFDMVYMSNGICFAEMNDYSYSVNNEKNSMHEMNHVTTICEREIMS